MTQSISFYTGTGLSAQGPKGDTGDKGDQGDIGPAGPVSVVPGPPGPPVPTGVFGAALLLSGTALSARDNLGLTAEVTPEMFGAVADTVIGSDGYTPTNMGTNNQTAFDNAVAFLAALGGGTLRLSPKSYRVSNGVRLLTNISLIGSCGSSKLYKSGTGTKTIVPEGVAAGGLASIVYPLASLPANISAVLILDGAGGRWIGRVSGVTLIGSLSGTNIETDLQTEFGYVSTGSVSDSVLENVTIWTCKQAGLLPDIFASAIYVNRANRCWRAFGINKGTSLTYHGNYASSCRDYGHSLHDIFYGSATGNACDNLNEPALYPTRTRISTAYLFDGLDGFTVLNNGQEQTYGRHWYVGVLNDCRIENNTSLGLGSDYVGAGIIAVWYLEPYSQQRTTIKNNPVITYMASGLLQGAATKAQHYNIYCGNSRDQRTIEWSGNTVRENRFGTAGGNGWSKTTDAAYGGTLNPPLEKVEYNILYNGVSDQLLAGAGVSASRTAPDTVGRYTFQFDTPFANNNFVCSWAHTRSVGSTSGEAMGIEIGDRTATSIAIECEYYEGTNYDLERIDLTAKGFVDRLA